uniref:FAE domain-containing protein n=1 Tax=Ananas comosus var. bracteatus TaxID=296719 RepID=A0A6V7QND2_ANACO|nr:unnamed protein product [Ananas comosus var. bracteatus]
MEESSAMDRERLTAEMAFRDSSIVIKIRRRLPDFVQSVNLKYVKLGLRYADSPAAVYLILPLVVLATAYVLSSDLIPSIKSRLAIDLATGAAAVGVVALFQTVYYLKRPRPVYLIEFACYKPDDEHKISKEGFLEMSESTGSFNGESLDFQTKITTRSGLGDETYLPPGIQARPPRLCMAEARREAEAVMFGCLDALFAAAGVDPRRDVRILVVNCSLFNPTPSLASMIVNHYRMREDIKSFNLGGWGAARG